MRPTGFTRLVAVVAVSLLAGSLAATPVMASTKSELQSARAKLHRLVDKIAAENALIQQLQSDANRLAVQIGRVQSQLAETEAGIVDMQQAIRLATDELQAAQNQLNQRAWTAYETGPGSSLEFLLGSTSLTDLSDRLEIVDHAAESDQDLINRIELEKALLQEKQVALQVLEERQRRQELSLNKQEDAIKQKLAEEQTVLTTLSLHMQRAERMVKRLKARLEQERLAAAAAHGGAGAIPGVFLVCPVEQPHGYGDDFGAPRYSGGFHPHAGNDIFAPFGTPIRAPFPGYASDASNGLGGLSVKVVGAAGYVYNAHLSQMAVSVPGPVSKGTIVGYVGDSGDALGGAPHDHFEWHPNVIPPNPHKSPYGYTEIGGAIDPYPYLNSVC
jgi:peptidoglycan hydrolase CwlO-like protein